MNLFLSGTRIDSLFFAAHVETVEIPTQFAELEQEVASIIEALEKELSGAFSPSMLEIVNESHLHAGHQPGFDGGGETHLRIRITADCFATLSRVERHRKVNEIVTPFMDKGLHAVAIEAS